MRLFLFLMGLCAFAGIVYLVGSDLPNRSTRFSETVNGQTVDGSKFRLVSGHFAGDYATYTFQTPPDEKNFADDCIGCEQEVGNAVIFAEFGCPKKSQYLFESNSERGVDEKTPILDPNGSKIGERRLVVHKDPEEGKVVGARLFWIEGQDFWAVQAPSVALTKALFESDEYKNVRKKVADEIRSYVPIQNANTKAKNRCEDGFFQRRIQH